MEVECKVFVRVNRKKYGIIEPIRKRSFGYFAGDARMHEDQEQYSEAHKGRRRM